jgi:hypothetical protein
MAKQQGASGDDRSDIEFLYFKGKMKSADISALVAGFTSTRSSSLSPRPAAPKRITPTGTNNGTSEPEEEEVELELVDEADVADSTNVAVAAPKARGAKRSYPTPDTVDIDLEAGEKPFRAFAAEKAPQSHHDKYLVAAEWLRAYGNTAEVSAGHVRTCYIGAGWNFDVVDPTQPFRKLKKEGLGTISDGKFTIKHLGTAEVNKMNPGATPAS